MRPHPHGMRKAAILVASLSRQAADRVLEQFEPEQAQRLRQALVELGDVDPQEQQGVIEEFFRVGPMVPEKHPPGIDLDDRLARQFLPAAAPPAADEPAGSSAIGFPPFRFLHEAAADKLARALAGERPQTIALVLSRLPPKQAGSVLARLEPPLQVEVIHRLIDLEETDPQILREVEQALEARLSQQVRMQRRRVAGLKAVAGILQASPRQVGTQILDNLAAEDPSLAEKLGPGSIEFEELENADHAAWAAIFRAAEPELAMLALVGASPALIERILRQLPPAQAEIVRHQLDHPGPIRLRDVEQARREIAHLAQHMAHQGRITLPHAARRRFPLGAPV